MSKRTIFTPIAFSLSRYALRSVAESHGSCQPDDAPKLLKDVAGAGAGADAAWTTAVWALVAPAEPTELVAVTTTRSVKFTSDDVSVYDELVAPVIALQLAPAASQRRQAYPYEVGLPDHVPVDAFRTLPAAGVPEIVGKAVLAGADVETGAAWTTAVWALVALAEPAELVAVTTTRSVKFTSEDVTV